MTTPRAEIGMCFRRTFPPALVTEVARRLEDGGADQLWIVEDCFYTAGVSLAATALAVTERLRVGLGILPAVARNPAITAMEIATLAGLAPGRVLAGIGHGVQSWMEQMGARPPSPVTTLDEVITAVRRLLAGELVTTHGRHVHLDDVRLDQPPAEAPPVLAGVRGPKSLAMAGRVAQGVVLAEPASPSYVRWALDQAGRTGDADFHVAVFAELCIEDDRTRAYQRMAPWLASLLDAPSAGLRALPFFDEMAARHADRGVDGLVTMPADWWTELAPIGALDDARAHVAALEAAGVHSIGLFPPPDLALTHAHLPHVLALAHP
jgi:alkanesulfonate monooxygenase SsuD/methylene tetrahydromethanopterin reductase-like flavin-dependent oxidoreductase (luciferase family)